MEVKEPVSSLAVYATCKVTNQSGKALELEKPDGSSETLPSGAASSLKLETYSVTFVADGSEVAVRQTVPGTPVDVTGITPEKEGYIFANPGSISLPKCNTEHSYIILEDNKIILKNVEGKIISQKEIETKGRKD